MKWMGKLSELIVVSLSASTFDIGPDFGAVAALSAEIESKLEFLCNLDALCRLEFDQNWIFYHSLLP